jgi:chromosome segregation ATPase
MWNFLSLLGSQATLDDFVRKESGESFEPRIARLEEEIAQLNDEISAAAPGSRDYETRMQLLASRQEGLAALQRRREQVDRARENVRLVRAEQDRIAEQLKLLRADLYAAKAVGQLSQRVSETIDQLSSSGRISAEIPPAVPELPAFRTRRVGYEIQKE